MQVAVTIFVCISLAAQIQAPERKVVGNVIISERDPEIRITLPGSARYAGSDRWVLYGIADCELHAFVEADERKNVQRFYWVQFESYLPFKPDLKHTYDSPRHTMMGGIDFYVDTWVRPNDAALDPGSDREHIEALIKAKGDRMPAGMMYVRFVHLLDDSKRKELMIIYGEDLSYAGHSAADLIESGKAHDRWPAIAEGLVSRAENGIKIEDPSHPSPRE
jgi:hypothetical protein